MSFTPAMSWFTSWLPGLPAINISLPTSIQSRFLSFLLKKTLGHFLKPGQLDAHQIDSQIGSGYVQVADLELSNEAINELLNDMPIELHDGSIVSVIARIPWPNPLTSAVGLSLDSLHLTFILLPSSKHVSNTTNLADSVASVVSVAETFIHDELTPREEFKLRESFYSELSPTDDPSVPGGLDPFITSPEYEDALPDIDPAGVSMFATLIERLLARFEFDAANTKITLTQPGRTSLTLSIADIRYRTEDRSDDEKDGKVRSVSITGITVSARNLRPTFDMSSSSSSIRPVSSPTSTLQSSSSTPRCPSPTSSSSSLDEDTQLAMSQSLAFLPPRPASPASSLASSMYQSAVSIQLERTADIQAPPPSLGEPSDRRDLGQAKDDDAAEQDEDIILSFGPDPISLRLTTPGPSSMRKNIASNENFKFSVTAGIIACSFRAWHVRSIMDIANIWTSHQRPPAPPTAETSPPSPPLTIGLEVASDIRGLIILFLPSASPDVALASNGIVGFLERPLVPPKLPQGYLRFHVEGISSSGEISLGSTEAARSSSLKGKKSASSTSLTLSVSLDELSAFAFRSSEPSSQDAYATPILITDFHLPESYLVPHQHPDPISKCGECPELPSFDTLDWTDDRYHLNGMRPSQWRTKHRHRSEKPTDPRGHPAVVVSVSQGLSSSEREKDRKFHQTNVEVKILPLHMFVDLRRILAPSSVIEFLDELTASHASSTLDDEDHFDHDSEDEDVDDAEGETPPATPRDGISRPKEREAERERRRLEQLVLKDLDLDFDYQAQKLPRTEQKRSARKHRIRKKEEASLNISVKLPLVRLQVRCPPPTAVSPRSGSLILDLHDIRVVNGPSRKPLSTRFADATPVATEGDVLAAVEVGRIVISSTTTIGKATALISIGPLAASDDHKEASASLLPRVVVTKSARTSTLALTISIPSVYVNMSKPALDGLQYWADDVTQLLEKAFGSASSSDDGDKSSIIGSRFFTQSRSGSGSETTTRASKPKQTETAVKVTIAEVFVRIVLPRKSEDLVPVRPLDLYASDLDILVEMKPDGKDETVVTVGVMDLTLKNADNSNTFETYLSLTAPRSLTATPQCLLRLQFTSLVIPETTAKESRIKISLWGFTFKLYPNIGWTTDIAEFVKAPPGAFESVIPSERTRISLRISDGSINALAQKHPGSVVVHIGDLEFGTNLVGSSSDVSFRLSVPALALLAIDDTSDVAEPNFTSGSRNGVTYWRKIGYALLAEVASLDLHFAAIQGSGMKVTVDHVGLRLHLCADTLGELIVFVGDLASAFKPPAEQQEIKPKRRPTMISEQPSSRQNLMSSIDDLAFKRVPEVGPAPDMIYDDLPTNLDYLDESFSAAAGLRELRDDDLEDFDTEDTDEAQAPGDQQVGIVSKVGGETIKMLRPEGIHPVEHYFDNLQPEPMDGPMELGERTMRIQLNDVDINVFLYGGYDWAKTRRIIEDKVREMRKRLAKIRQLVASGQTQDTLEDETSALLFNSVYIGLDQDADELEPGALIAAIDEELKDDYETASQSSWQSLKPSAVGKTQTKTVHGKRLTRAKGPSIEFRLAGTKLNVDQYKPEEPTVSRIFSTVRDLEILDHMKTSTWNKFLTSMRSDSRGNVRETDSNMVRVELRMIHPVHGHSSEEARLKAKILPLRLHVDQDALDFLKSFFSFKDPHALPSPPKDSDDDIFFQLAEIFPIDIKMDYKPRRVDYRALKQGRTIELMNFFHFDGSEMTLRHITLAGISGWPRLFDLLNDLWTPDVKATQLVDVISGVAPIRSVVNVGSGIADLVLLPIAQYKKDGRIVRGVQKGATAFVKSTAIEAIKLGAHLATGTQVILEQAEGVLGGQFDNPIMAETLQGDEFVQYGYSDEDETVEMISKYAEQPADIKEGVQSAYRSLHRNLNSAAQTILAVPMEVYERSGNEGPVRSVIRAVPIAVLKPMIGATEAVSKTLLGLHNTLDPNVRHDNQAKYKQR